jgi:hypothetical protein
MSIKLHVKAGLDEIFVCRYASGFEFSSITNTRNSSRHNENLVEFFCVQPLVKKVIEKNSYLEFSYKYENIVLEIFEGINFHKINLNDFPDDYYSFIVHCYIESSSYDYEEIDNLKLRLFSSWLNGTNRLKWTDFSSYAAKQSWLDACYLWEQKNNKTKQMYLNNAVNIPEIINIPGSNILGRKDFYCFIGDAILGYRGYMGENLDGFHERLEKIVKTFKSKIEFNVIDSMDLFNREDSFFTAPFISAFKDIISCLGCKLNLK